MLPAFIVIFVWSWVARYPYLDLKAKRLAEHVENHSIDYAPFEVNVPEGR